MFFCPINNSKHLVTNESEINLYTTVVLPKNQSSLLLAKKFYAYYSSRVVFFFFNNLISRSICRHSQAVSTISHSYQLHWRKLLVRLFIVFQLETLSLDSGVAVRDYFYSKMSNKFRSFGKLFPPTKLFTWRIVHKDNQLFSLYRRIHYKYIDIPIFYFP